jgi:hypothetical protein
VSPTTPLEFIGRVYALLKTFTLQASVTRWGSTEKHTVAVGGFDGDPHTWWAGADVVWDVLPDETVERNRAMAFGLKAIREKDHTHFQPWDWPAGDVTRPPAWWQGNA